MLNRNCKGGMGTPPTCDNIAYFQDLPRHKGPNVAGIIVMVATLVHGKAIPGRKTMVSCGGYLELTAAAPHHTKGNSCRHDACRS